MKVNLEVYSQRGLQITDRAVDVLAQEGFDPVYGARPLRRAIQSALQNKVADKLLEEDFDAEHIIVVDAEGEMICLGTKK